LRRAVNYPGAAHSRAMAESAKVLEKVELGHLAERLDEEGPWDQILSGGEKQRLAFARLFLHRPDIIVLDEATAALDSRSQDRLMGLLSREFTDATVVSIGHRPELAAFHQPKIVLERSGTGAKLVDEAGADRIGDAREYDRHSAGRLQEWCDRGAGIRQDDVRRERDQFRRVFANSVGIGDTPAGVDADVAAVEPAQLREPLQGRRSAGLKLRVVSGAGHQHADAPHPLRLLRARREGPSRRRTAEQRDELAASNHSITSSARTSSAVGIVMPSALAVLRLI